MDERYRPGSKTCNNCPLKCSPQSSARHWFGFSDTFRRSRRAWKMNRNTPGEILPLREHQPRFLRSLRRGQDESRRRNRYKRCSYPTLRSRQFGDKAVRRANGDIHTWLSESVTRNLDWSYVPERRSSTRCTMTSSGRELRICRASVHIQEFRCQSRVHEVMT